MDSSLLDILACPVCKGHLRYDRVASTLDCEADQLAFPIRDGIPVLIESEAVAIGDKHRSADPRGAASGSRADAGSDADTPRI